MTCQVWSIDSYHKHEHTFKAIYCMWSLNLVCDCIINWVKSVLYCMTFLTTILQWETCFEVLRVTKMNFIETGMYNLKSLSKCDGYMSKVCQMKLHFSKLMCLSHPDDPPFRQNGINRWRGHPSCHPTEFHFLPHIHNASSFLYSDHTRFYSLQLWAAISVGNAAHISI